MAKMRKPFQGVLNIIRFNWHFFVISFGLIILVFLFANIYKTSLTVFINILCLLGFLSILISLIVSFYVYDLSNLYELNWATSKRQNEKLFILNINAGFDETTELLKQKFPNATIQALDFYNPNRHTEISIKRARKAYPPYPNTKQVETQKLPFEANSIDKIFLILSAHEIRNSSERNVFFAELRRILKNDGEIILAEHLRDTPNFLAYNIGAFHFHTKNAWLENFRNAKLEISEEFKITPFITTFILRKNGTTY